MKPQNALDAEFKQQSEIVGRCFSTAFDLLRQGKKDEAKKIEREGDIAAKRIRQLLKEIKASK